MIGKKGKKEQSPVNRLFLYFEISVIRPERHVLVDDLDPVALRCDRPDNGPVIVLGGALQGDGLSHVEGLLHGRKILLTVSSDSRVNEGCPYGKTAVFHGGEPGKRRTEVAGKP